MATILSKTRYPIYVLSKGRWKKCMTATFLQRDNVEFFLVVEAPEEESYRNKYTKATILVLPPESTGYGAIPVRNFIWQHAIDNGHARHWQLDDNIQEMYRYNYGKRIRCHSLNVFRAAEDFTDRYENIGIAGMNYYCFAIMQKMPPFYHNVHVYSCMLIQNDMPYRWRGTFNADTDLCLQVLSSGNLCTILFNAFLADKIQTMTMKGGNTTSYKNNDGRLKMAKALERVWPGVVETKRKFKRPQHHIKNNWKNFDTPLVRKNNYSEITKSGIDNYSLGLIQFEKIRSPRLKKIFKIEKEKKL